MAVFGIGRHKLTIIYKSGVKLHLRADEFDAKWYQEGGGVSSLSWRGMGSKSPIYAGLENIEAIYNGWV